MHVSCYEWRPGIAALFSEWKDRRRHWTNNPRRIHYFCVIPMGGYHFNRFLCVSRGWLLSILVSAILAKPATRIYSWFSMDRNDLWSRLYKTYNPSFSNCPRKPNNLDFPWIVFSLLSKMSYTMARLALFVFTKMDKICQYDFKL